MSPGFLVLEGHMRIAFDNDLYLKLQSENIIKRVNQFGDKLYLEFGESFLMIIMQVEFYQAFYQIQS